MKKTIFALAALAALAMACAKEQQPSDTPAEVQKTYLNAYVEDTKVSVDGKGVCSWQEGDVLAVWFVTDQETVTDENGKETVNEISGVRLEFTYESDNADGSAKFATTADVPEEFYSARAAFPASSVSSTGGFSLERNYTYDADSVPVYLRDYSVIRNEDGSLSSNLVHNASIMKFTLRDIPAYAAGFILEFTGNVNIKTEFPYKTGYDEDIVLHSVAAQGRTPIRFYLIDGDEDIIEGTVKTFKEGTKPVDTNSYIDMGLVDFQKENLRKDYVKVCGIKWAKGNLQCYKDNGDAGFQNGWRIAPAQWHNLHYKEASTASEGEANSYGYSNDSNKFEHFNYGGIARQARFVSAGNYIVEPASGLDISGKVYSDSNATTEVTGNAAFKEIDTFASTNHNELWGDIAYWASKGQFRLPKNTEMVKLHNVSDKLAGYYKTSDGSVVYGFLYRTPNPSRVTSGTNQEFTDADLESGLFLPKAGRRGATSSASGTIINVMTQGMYRTSTYVKSVTYSNVLYYCSAYYSLGDAGKLADDNLKVNISSILNVDYKNAHQAGHLIRPVLAETAE